MASASPLAQRQGTQRDIVEYFDQNTAQPERQHGSELWIAADAHEELNPVMHHLLDHKDGIGRLR